MRPRRVLFHCAYPVAICALFMAGLSRPASAALLDFAIRVAPQGQQPSGVTVINNTYAHASPGVVVQLELWAIIQNLDHSQQNDGFIQGQGSFQSTQIGANPVLLGSLRGGSSQSMISTVNNVQEFSALGSASGFVQDVDSDTDLDVGDISVHTSQPPSSSNLWFVAKANEFPSPHLGTNASTDSPLEQLIGTTTFTLLAGSTSGQSTLVDFIPRKFNSALSGKIFWYRSDGVDLKEAYTSVNITHTGATIDVAVPEPSGVILAIIGLLMFLWMGRRGRSRRMG